jgi:hypothetical protein
MRTTKAYALNSNVSCGAKSGPSNPSGQRLTLVLRKPTKVNRYSPVVGQPTANRLPHDGNPYERKPATSINFGQLRMAAKGRDGL